MFGTSSRIVASLSLAVLASAGLGTATGYADTGAVPSADPPTLGAPEPKMPAPPAPALPGVRPPAKSGIPLKPADPREAKRALDELYDRLAKAPDDRTASQIALRIERRWMQSGSPTVDLLMVRAMAAMANDEMPVALDLLDAVVTLKPDYAQGWSLRATAEFQSDGTGAALADLHRALALDPRNWNTLVGIATVMSDLDKKKEALAAYDAALKIYPRLETAKKARDELAPDVEGKDL